MTKGLPAISSPMFDIAALAALAWVAAATLHEGAGHGLACLAVGGEPLRWSTFHFGCGQGDESVWDRRIVASAGSLVNLVLSAIGWAWWRASRSTWARLAAWIVLVLNGLTAFGYLVFSAAFDIGDWNRAGVLLDIVDVRLTRGVLAIVGVAGYAAVVRGAARLLSRTGAGDGATLTTRRVTMTVWATTGLVSLLAALMSGSDWHSTAGAAFGVALGGNAGLLTIARFSAPTLAFPPNQRWGVRMAAVAAVTVFVAVVGPGIALRQG